MKENILEIAKETNNTEFPIVLQHMMQGKTVSRRVKERSLIGKVGFIIPPLPTTLGRWICHTESDLMRSSTIK
jgi:hypothetical protein